MVPAVQFVIFLFKNVEKHFVIFNSFLLHYTFEFLKEERQNFIIDKAYVNKKRLSKLSFNQQI